MERRSAFPLCFGVKEVRLWDDIVNYGKNKAFKKLQKESKK